MDQDAASVDDLLAIARRRKAAHFFIVDGDAQVLFRSAAVADDAVELPPNVTAAARRLIDGMAESGDRSAVSSIPPDQLVRVLELTGSDGRKRYAVFVERFAVRNSLQSAVLRFKLTAREEDVLDGLLRAESSQEIAARLFVSVNTVHEHIRKIGRKMGTTKRGEMVATIFGLR